MMDKFFTVVSTLFVVQLLLYYHEVSAGSCRAIYGERFRCISPHACAQKNRVWKTRCGPKANGVCCQVMNEDHQNFKRCGIRVQRHAIHRHHPYGSSLKHFQPSSESMRTSEKINIPWVILANKGSDFGENWFQNDYIALSNSKKGFYRSRKNSNNQEENTDNDRYSVKNYVENSSATSRNSKLKIEVTNEIVEVSTKYDIQLNDTLYNNGENIKMTTDDLMQSTNSCSTIGCSTNIIKSVVNDDVTEASNETSEKLEGGEETYFKMPTNSQISITENNKTLNPEDMNQFKNENSFSETFGHVANSTETVTNTIVNQFSEESLRHSLGQENNLNNNFDSITTDEEQFNNTNDEYNDNETMTIIENATKLQDETTIVEAVESEEKGNLEDDSELLKIFSSENTVAVENESTSKLISESEQKTNLESFVEVTNENYSSQELKSEKTINTQNMFELSNESFSKLVSGYEETTNVQQTQYKEEFELVKKTHLDDSSELVTESSIEEKTVAGEEVFSDAIFPEEEENISIPYSEYEKTAITGVSIELLNESSLTQEFGLLNENSSILVSESKKNTNVQENAESTNGIHYKKEYQLKEKTNLEGSSEIVTESPLEESTISGEDYFSEATTVEEKEENISKSDAEVKEKTISNNFTEMTNKNSFSQESKSEETIHAESTFDFPNENSSEFVLESENTTNVQETAETTNETHYKEEHELEENTNLERSSESMTESPLEESTTSGEDYFSEATTVKEKEGNISKSNSEAKEKTISNTSIEMTNETSFSQESKSEETIHAENTFEFPNENSSEFVSESEDTTNVQETAESTNKTHYKEEHELEEKTNLEGSSESLTQSPLEESTISGEDYFSEASTVKEKEKSISKSDSEAKEKIISNIFTEMTNKNSFSQESKSEETIHAASTFEFPNENSSEFVLESENTTNVQETAETTNEIHYKEEHELEENTNLEGSSESMTESPLEESTTSGEDFFSEVTTVKEKEGNISKSNSEAKEKTISNTSIEMTNETSFSQESKSEETIHAENTFEFPNENSSEFVSESEDTTNVQETAESTNKTHYMEEHELEEKTNVEGSSESVTQSPLEESTISGEEYFSEAMTAEEKEKSISKSDSEAKDKTISNISTEITNSFSQESKSEETIKAENIFELPNENSSEFMSTFVESTNEAHYEEEVVKKTNLNDSREIVTESSLEERAILGEKNFSEATAQAQSISKLEYESESKTISEVSVEMTDINSLSQESNSEEPANAQFTEISNEITSKLISESQEITSAKEIFESLNETNYEEDAGLEEKTNLEASGELVTENPSNEMTISKEEILYETTVDVENENVSKSVSGSEGNKENSVEVSNENSLNKELKSENTSNVEINIELENANSSIFESETKSTTSVQQTSGMSNETYFEGETKLEIYTNLEGSSKLVTENSLKENTISEEDIFSETTIKAQKESIPKTSLSTEITNSENFIEITKEISSNRESKSEETISTQTTFELPNENSSKSVSESEETTNMQENAAFINEKPYKHELELKEQTNLEGSSELETENSLKESTISEENISSETIIKALNESISRNSLSAELTNSENFVEITKETSSNRESKSVEAISTQNIFELSNGNSSNLVSESEETTKIHENAAFTNETHYKDELQLKEKTNLENSSELVTENSLKESTISEEDVFSEPTVEVEKEKLTKTNYESEIKTVSEVSIEMTNINSLSQESKSEELINAQITFELPNENYSKLMPDSEETTNFQKTAEFLNETNYEEEVDSEEKTNLESSSELMSEIFLEERTISGEEDIFETTIEAEKEYVTKPDSKFEEETNSEKFVEIANENSSIKESKSEEKINSYNSFELQNGNASKLEFESEETTNVQESAKLTVESTTNLEGSNKLTNVNSVEEIKVEAENSNTSKAVSEFEEQSSSEGSVKVSSKSSSSHESGSEETIYAQNTLELPNEDSSKLVSEAQETENVQETDEMRNETHYNEELELRKKTNILSSSELMTEKHLKQRTLSEEDFSQITVEAETKNILTEVSEIEQKTNIESFVEVTNENSSGQLSELEVTVSSQNAFELPIEGSSDVFVSEETTSIQETVEFTNEKKTNSDGNKLVNESYSEVEEENTETSKEVSQSEEKSNSKSFVKVTNENSSTQKPESEKSTKEQNTFEIANEESLKKMAKPEKTENMQEIYELMTVTHYKPEFEEKTNFEDSYQPAYKSTFKEEPTSERDTFSGTTVEAENKRTSKEVFEYEEKTNSQIFAEIEKENSSIQKSETEETTNEKNNIEMVNENSSKLMYEFEETTNLQETVKSTVELENGTLHRETSKPEQETDLKIISRATNNNSYSVMPESKEAKLTEMTFGNEQNILFSTSISAKKSIPETTVTTVNEAVSVQMSKSEKETFTESTFKQEHEKFYNGFPEIQEKRDGLSDERFYKNISESKKEEKLKKNTQQMNENLYKDVSEAVEESRISSKATMKDSNKIFYKGTSASKKDSYQKNTTELPNENITDKTTILEENNNSESVTQIVNENISKEKNEAGEKTIWETIIESVTKMFSKQESEYEKINLMSTVEMPNEGYSKTAYEYEEKANQLSTENFYKDVSEFKEDIDVVSSQKLTNEMYDMEVSEVKAKTTKAYTVEINNKITSEEVNEYKEKINLQSTVGSAGEKSYTGVSAYEEKTNTEILDVAKEESDKKISEFLLDVSPGIPTKVESEDYPKGTSEIEETINPLNNSENVFEGYTKGPSNHTQIRNLERKIKLTTGNFYKESIASKEEANPITSSDLINEDIERGVLEVLVDASMKPAGEMANENIFTNKFETDVTINPLNNSEEAFEGIGMYHTEVSNLDSKIELTIGNSYNGSTESEEETNPITSSDLMHEITKTEVPKILVDASMKTSGEMANENIFTNKFETDVTINPLNNSEEAFEGIGMYHTEGSNLDSKIELTIGNSYNGSTESEEETNPITSSDLMHEITKTEVPKILVDASMKTSREMANENIFTNKFEIDVTINPLNNSEEAFEGIGMYHTEVSNLDSKIELTIGNSYNGSTESEEETNPITSSDLMHEITKTEVPKILVDASMKTSREMANENIFTNKFETDETINPLNNSEEAFEGIGMYHTEVSNLDSKIELTIGNSYNGSTESEEETNPITSSDLMHEITKTEVPKILVDASMKTSREMANENIFTNKFETDVTINPLNNSEEAFEGIGMYHTEVSNLDSKIELTIGNSYNGSTESEEETNPITSSDLMHEITKTEVPKILVDASMKTSREMANENIFTNKFETDETINPLNNSEEAFEGIGMYHTEVSNLDSKIELTIGNSYNGSTESEEETNPITSSDLMHEITKTEVPKILVDASMKTSREMANENIFTNKFETDVTINPLNNSEEAFEGIGMYHTEVSNLDSKIELTIGNSYNGSTESEEETNPITSSDLMHEITKTEVPKILVDASMKTSREMANENIFTNKFETDETINPLNNSEEAFEGIGMYHTEVSNLESKIELTIGNSYNGSTESEEETNPITSSDLMHEITKTEVPKILVDASMKTSREMANENIFTNKFETDETINPLNNSEEAFEGIGMYHTEVSNLESKIELTIGNSYNGSTESEEETNPITSSDLMHEITKTEVPKILVDASMKTSRELANENIFTNKFKTDETINPLNNSEEAFEGIGMYHTEVSNLDSKIELTIGNSYNGSTESEEETNPITSSDLMHEITKTEVPKILVDASMKTSREMKNENISTDKFESEKTPNIINNSEMVFEDYSKNVFGHTKSTNVESNTELRKENSYNQITGSVQETNPRKSISNGITSHVMIEDEIWDKIYGTTTEEEIRLSNTDIKFYDGRENIHPGYTNEKEFHNSHTEISEYSTDNKNNLDIQIATSNSNKTSKTVTELNKNSDRSEILTKAPTHINRSDIVLEGDEENVPTIDLENLTNNSSTEIHESLENNTNVTMDKLLTEVSSENVLDVSDSFGLTTKYPNHFSNTEIQIYKSNDITTSQDFVVNENVSPYKETSKYIEKASDNSESIAEDQTQFSNAEISFQQSEANFTFQYAVKNEGVGVQMNSSTSYGSFSETSTNEIFTNVSNENTRRTIEEYDTLDEEVADITTKDKKKFSNDEINFHENEKMTDSIFFETFITVINETSTEALEVLSKYFDISTENKIQITNPDIHLYTNAQNISIHKAPDLQEVMDEDRTESNNKNVSFLTSDNDFYKISDDFAKEDKTENESFIATTKSQFHFNNTETEFYGNKKITNKDTHFYVSELNSKVTTEFENINSFKNMSGDNKNFPENVTSPIFIDDSAGRFSHVIDGNKNSNTNFVISTEKQFPFNRTETELSENEERISPREVVEFESSSVNVEISNYETNTVKMIKNSSVDVDDDKYNTQNEAEAQFLNSSEDIGKGTLVKTKYTIDSLKKDFTSKYNTYSTFIEKKYHKYPDETIQQFMMKTTVVPPKPDHTDNLNVYKYDMDKTNTYHKDNTKLQPLENINKYYDYGGQSFNSIRQVARDEYHKAYFLSKMFENQPAFAQKFQHPMSYQNPNFMNERPINFPGPYYESNILQPYAQSYPYLYDQFNVNYPVSRFYQAGLFQQPLFSHNMVNPLPNNYRPYYGSENYQPSVQSYPSIYNKHDLGNMYPNKLVDFSTFHQKGFYRQPNPMYMIANPSLRRYRRSYGSESLQHSVQSNPSILKEYSLKKIEENQSTDLPKYHQVGLNKQLNPIYGVTESLLNKDNTYFRADSHPFFVKTHLNALEPFDGKGQLDEFANKEDGIIQGKPEMSHFGTKNDPTRKQHIKKRKHYTKSKLRNGNRSLNSVVKKRGIELPAFSGNSKKFSNHKKDTFGMGRTEEPFRQAYRESIDRDNLLHVIEYLPPEKTYRKRIFNNETLDVTENKSIKHQTAHYSILDKILSTSIDYYKVPAGEKYFTNEYTVRKNEKYSKDKSEGDKLIEKSKSKGKRQKEELKPIKRNLKSVLISETQNTSQGLKNSNSYQENTLTSSLHENVTLFNDLDAVLNDVEFFPVRSEVQKTNVRRSNVPGISRKEANLQEGRTIGGKLEYENWPWIVSIYKLPDMFHVCSGTLIDDRHILTAAHCFLGHDYGEYVASVGSLLKISDPNQGYLVEDKILHTDFKKDCYCNDIALLRLKNPVDDHLTPICLSAIDTAVVGENTTLLGWGDIKFMAGRGKSGTDRLQRLNNLPITSSEECRKTYSRILGRDLSKNFSESYVCAGVPDGSKDACVGDSGGPLLHRSYDGSWTLLGVVSFGYKCGSPGVPGIYTRVSYYLEWIYGAIDKFNLSHLYDKPHSN